MSLPPSTTSLVPLVQVKSAVRALYSLIQAKKQSNELFDDEGDISLTISLNKIPQKGKSKPIPV